MPCHAGSPCWHCWDHKPRGETCAHHCWYQTPTRANSLQLREGPSSSSLFTVSQTFAFLRDHICNFWLWDHICTSWLFLEARMRSRPRLGHVRCGLGFQDHKADESSLWKQGSEQGAGCDPVASAWASAAIWHSPWSPAWSLCLSRMKVSAMRYIFQIHVASLDPQHGTKCASLGNWTAHPGEMAAWIHSGWVEVPRLWRSWGAQGPWCTGCGRLTKGSPGVLLTATEAEGCGLHMEGAGLVSDPIPPKL